MEYTIITLPEKTAVGLTARTKNSDPKMTEKIGSLWKKFFEEEIYASIPNKVNDCTIGLYSNYENDVDGFYDITVCCETSDKVDIQPQLKKITIPAGTYAKFTVHGQAQEAVGKAWQEIWQTKLNRKYSFDFEEYHGIGDNAQINFYISIHDCTNPHTTLS